jgi:hypothetical protein
MAYDDIYRHVTEPQEVYLFELELNGILKIFGMASYNRRILSGIPSLIVEGIAISPSMQGKSLFKRMTEFARGGEAVICLRTQNPRMYRALEKYCSFIYPNGKEIPLAIRVLRDEFALCSGCKADEKGIVRGYYGGLFYGEEPKHKNVGEFFRKIGLNLYEGDALLAVGIK